MNNLSTKLQQEKFVDLTMFIKEYITLYLSWKKLNTTRSIRKLILTAFNEIYLNFLNLI